MSSYFFLQIGLCRSIEDGASKKKPASWHREYFAQAAGFLESVSETEDGTIWKSPPARFNVPAGAVPSTEEAYTQALGCYLAAKQKKEEAAAKEKALKKQLRTGKLYAGEEEDTPAMPDPATVAQQVHFLSDITVLDFEATGNDPLELAAVRYRNFEPVGELQSFIRFTGQVPSFITGLTGITSADVRSAPDAKQVLSQFKALAGDSLLVAHNAQYDLRILETTRTRLGATAKLPSNFLCTLQVAKDRYEGPHKLGELCQRFDIPNAGAHRAMNDVRMCFNLLRHMHADYDVAASLMNVANLTKAKRKPAQPSLFAA